MRVDVTKIRPIHSSFFSCAQDTQTILKQLFVKSGEYSDRLKRLLVINNPDCLNLNSSKNEEYKKLIDSKPLSVLRSEGYIRTNPKIARKEFDDIKSFILLTYDNFSSNSVDPKFMDCTLNFDIICYDDEWDLENFQTRPIVIAGYIDGILNSLTDNNKIAWQNRGTNSGVKLSGMGEYYFLGLNLVVLNEDISMYTLSYRALHFTEDKEKMGSLEFE